MTVIRAIALMALVSAPLHADEPSFETSFLSGLLDTLAQTEDEKNCPGVCKNTLSSSDCPNVLNEVTCSNPSMKCCIDKPVDKCSGVCVEPRVAQYCKAYLTTSGLCVAGKYCCVKDINVDQRSPDLVIPGEENTTRGPDITASLPQCPGYCMLNIMSAFCERSAVLLSNTSCKSGTVCCDNTRAPHSTPQPTMTSPTLSLICSLQH